MQLKHIKLAGFKSFVDPTRISFPTNMVAVVGPNGCGKSNIIDAVRWVLGELSAKNLRGDSMSDVIFNGSEQRKPSGQCSIELLFDNSSGKVGGEYSAFNEISVKRVMTRDSQSSYYINNTKCRRKDVQDIFLGTGLGPSSYAIIEQGMVSSLVSAKPEELRTHIEEAAGVSKYRERRKETESRIKKTKENLSRVNDIRDEIGRLIRRLESQAKAADRYKDYKNQEKEKELNVAILFSLDARDKRDLLNNNLAALQKDESVKESEVSVKQAKLDQYKTEHESVLSKYEDAQKKFYEVGSEIARFEQNLQNIRTEGPANHYKKSDTPTMGGILMIVPFLIFLTLITINLGSLKLFLVLMTSFGFFITGFLDDYISIKNKENTGLKTKEKFFLQSIVSIIFILLAYEKNLINPLITVSDSWEINMNIFILPISFLVLVGMSNSVNLTDGLDGLAAGCSGIVFYGLGTEILMKEQQDLFVFSILCYSMCGICFGFLKYNSYPAKVFMGDTGSLSIGAILGSIALLTNSIFTLSIFSGIFIIESLSVIIQVGFFKITKKLLHKGKRVFLMAPLHHHFELQGIKEQKIVENFWKINILLVILGIVLKINL